MKKSLICNETIEGYLAAIKHLEILFGNSQNDSICGKMAAAPAVEWKLWPKFSSMLKIQVNTFKIVFWLNAALVFWRLRSKGILVGRWSVKQRKHSVTRHWDNRLKTSGSNVHSNWMNSVLWHSLSLWNFVCGHNSLHPKSHCIWDRFLILIHKTVSYIPILGVLVKEVLSGPGPWLEHVYIYIRICKVRAIFLAGQVGTYLSI